MAPQTRRNLRDARHETVEHGLSSNLPEIGISQPNLNTNQTSSQVFGDVATNQVEHAHGVKDSGEFLFFYFF